LSENQKPERSESSNRDLPARNQPRGRIFNLGANSAVLHDFVKSENVAK
jgi:hypothetical protein